jgi:hypothetical protein
LITDPKPVAMKRFLLISILCFFVLPGFTQETARIFGIITGFDNKPVFPASITIPETPFGTVTDENGHFELQIPANQDLELLISYLGYKQVHIPLKLQTGEQYEIKRQLEQSSRDLEEVVIREQQERSTTITRIDIKSLEMLPNISGNIETILLTLPGVASRNELSSQYSVRGGNFDENLVYVNDIEIHRPFLIRSGQQEGLSFVNSDMVSSIKFSAGGFDAMYGDKMSSVLDITYRRPVEFGGSANLSLLGGSFHMEDRSGNQRLTHTSGFRYKTSQYLLGSLETQGEYHPDFYDFQTFMTYRLSPAWELSLLGNIASNRFRFSPETRSTDFGTFNNPLNLVIYFDGQEFDRFDTYTAAITAHYTPIENLSLKFIGSGFNSIERENYDIQGQYLINELDNRVNSATYGDSILNIGIGSMLNHARNDLNALVKSFSHIGTFIRDQNTLKWGLSWQQERINDKISEWGKVDSAGYSIPYSSSNVLLYNVIKSENSLNSNRLSSFVRNTYTFERDSVIYFVSGGIRASWWDFNGQLNLSPRINLSVKPNWKRDIVFRLASGYYYQPPFYRELIYPDGRLNKDVKAQRSIHFVIGGDYDFYAWNRPFKFSAEVYYKDLDYLIPYKLDNVRIQYAAENIASGYAAGIDFKIHGEFVPGADSWASLSFMKTEENIGHDSYTNEDGHQVEPGYYPRPTDQRVMAGIFFRDYLPNNPDYKVHLNLVYGTGLPFSPPDHDRYDLVFRMPDYKRVDIGFSKNLINNERIQNEKNPFRHLKNTWISLEIFNLLGVKNTISYLWIKTVSNQDNAQGQFAVPNYLTGRRINARLSINF